MGQASRGRAEARGRVAEMRAQQAAAERKRKVLLALAAVGTVVAVIVALVVVKLTTDGDESTPVASASAPAAVVKTVTSVSAASFEKAGAGETGNAPKAIKAPALTAGGKPKILYVGAEYCPYCAAERWPIAVALSRFGTWKGLGQTTSAGKPEAHPNTATLSFKNATFTSDYLAFTGVEQQDRAGKALQKIGAADDKVLQTYNKPPYVSTANAIPFVDLGGTFVSQGATYVQDPLDGKTPAQIAAGIADPTSKIGKGVLGAANQYTAAICQLTKDEPATVCGSSAVKAAAATLQAAG